MEDTKKWNVENETEVATPDTVTGGAITFGTKIKSDCADITFINQSGAIIAGVLVTDDVLVDNMLLRFGQSFTDACFGNEIRHKVYQIKWLTTNSNNLAVYVRRKHYVSKVPV